MPTPLDHVRAIAAESRIVADAPRCCNGDHPPAPAGDGAPGASTAAPCPGRAVADAGGLDLTLCDIERAACARLATATGDGEVAAIVRALARGAQARAWLDAEDVLAVALADAGIRARADLREARAVLGTGEDGSAPPCGDAHAHHAALLGIGRCPACAERIGMGAR